MADFILQNGREITFDLDQLTYGQWLGIHSPTESEERTDKTLARVSGLELKEVKALKILEFKRLIEALRKRVQQPLQDPNA